jgi:elongator complex protein 1
VIVTGTNKLLLLSTDFQVINESFLDNDVPLEEMVALGWGKKETQFHGSEGKHAALVKSVGKLSENDDGKVRVSWKGDAEYFVVSFVNADKRSLKVYNRMGGLHSESEEVSFRILFLVEQSGTCVVMETKRKLDNLVSKITK